MEGLRGRCLWGARPGEGLAQTISDPAEIAELPETPNQASLCLISGTEPLRWKLQSHQAVRRLGLGHSTPVPRPPEKHPQAWVHSLPAPSDGATGDS